MFKLQQTEEGAFGLCSSTVPITHIPGAGLEASKEKYRGEIRAVAEGKS